MSKAQSFPVRPSAWDQRTFQLLALYSIQTNNIFHSGSTFAHFSLPQKFSQSDSENLNAVKSRDTWDQLDKMEAAQLPAAPVNDMLQMHADPQALARDMTVEVDHSTVGKVKTIGHPVKFSRTPAKVADAAPILGQHTREVLGEIGYDAAQIKALIQSQAVVAA